MCHNLHGSKKLFFYIQALQAICLTMDAKQPTTGHRSGVISFTLPIDPKDLLVSPNETRDRNGWNETVPGELRPVHELTTFPGFEPSNVGKYGKSQTPSDVRVSEECVVRLYRVHPQKTTNGESPFLNSLIREPLLNLIPPDLRQFAEVGSDMRAYACLCVQLVS